MRQLTAWAQAFAMGLGGPGLFLVAVLDASLLSMPELVDLLIVLMTIQHKSWVLYYAAAGTAGSVLGSMSVHYLGRKGGEALLRRRFSADRVDRVLGQFRRWGMITILVPAMLPPPTPFKLLCLAAGATGMTARTFALASTIGRGLRYTIEGLLAYFLGDMTIQYLDRHGRAVGWWCVGLSALAVAVYYWYRVRRQTAPEAQSL
jgi:membrane protein YqaA with SNARE-associated domain